MTATQAAAEPTYDDLSAAVAQLAKQVADLTGQLCKAHENARLLRQERDQALARADANARLAGAFRNDLDDVRTELRRTRDICRELAVVKGALEQQIDRMQTQPEPQRNDRTRRWPFRHLGNQL